MNVRHHLSIQRGKLIPIRDEEPLQFVMAEEIIHQTVEVAVSGHNDSLVIVGILNHGVQDEFRIYVAFCRAVRQPRGGLKDEYIPVLLEHGRKRNKFMCYDIRDGKVFMPVMRER
jgi:hypothetical protein